MKPVNNRNILLFIWLVILVNAILLFSSDLLPFVDLPNHLAEATIFKYYGKPETILSDYYIPVPWYFPNTFHVVFIALFPTVEFGNKIFYLLCAGSLLFGMYLIIKELKGNLWYGLFAVLFIFNYNISFGFSGFAIAIPTTLFLFYVILRDAKESRLAFKIWIALILILLYLMHAQVALYGLVLYGLMMLYRYWGNFPALITRGLLVPLPLLLVIVIWWMNREAPEETSTLSYLAEYYKTMYFQELYLRYRLIFFDNFQLRAGIGGYIIGLAFFSMLNLPFLIYYKSWKLPRLKKNLPADLVYPFLFLFSVFACYALLPTRLPGQWPLSDRFCTIVVLAFIIFGSVLLRAANTGFLRGLVITASVVYMVLWGDYLFKFNKENKGFDPGFFSGIPAEAKVSGLIYDHTFRGRQVYIHYPNYFLVWNKGLATTKMIDFRFGVVRRGAKGNEIPEFHELMSSKFIDNSAVYDDHIDYFIVRGKAPFSPDPNLKNYSMVKQEGEWMLYKRNG